MRHIIDSLKEVTNNRLICKNLKKTLINDLDDCLYEFFQNNFYLDDLVPDHNNQEKHIGIEIECLMPKTDLQVFLAFFRKGLDKIVRVDGDGSIRTCKSTKGYNSFEIKVLTTKKKLAKDLKDVMKVLKSLGAKTNDSCGLHIHLDIRNRDYDHCMERLYKYQKMLYSRIPKSRKKSKWFRRVKKETGTRFNYYTYKNEKYVNYIGDAFNTRHIDDTIEVRIHHGNLNYKNILNWIRLLNAIVDSKEKPRFTKEVKAYIKSKVSTTKTVRVS